MLRMIGLLLLGSGLLSPTLLTAQTDSGLASFYSDSLAGHKTASGEPYDPAAFTAAHPNLRFGIRLVVTNPANGKAVTVRVNDRGPFVEGRILDLSRAAADAIGLTEVGVGPVEVRVLKAGEDGPFAETASQGAWFQMGAFRTQTNAQTQARNLVHQGFAPRIRKDGGLFRVYLAVADEGAAGLAVQLTAGGWKGFLQLSREPAGIPVNLSTD